MIKKLFVLIFIYELCFLPVHAQKTNIRKKDFKGVKTNVKIQIKTVNTGKKKITEPKIRKRNYDKYKYDEANRLIEINSLEKGKIKITYDEYSRLKSKNKSNIEFENYYYDILGRETKIEYKSNGRKDTVKFKYSTTEKSYKLGNMTEKIEKYEHSFYKWDGRRLLEEKKIINGHKFVTKYKYNKNRNLSEIHYPSGLIVSYQYNDKNKIDKVSVTIGNKTIDAFKTRKKKDSTIIEYGNGLKTEISSNIDKRTVSMKTGGIQDLEFRFNNKGLIDRVKDNKNLRNKKDFYYDQHERLITAYGPWGKISYRYDSMDNLILKKENKNELKLKYNKKSAKIKELTKNGEKLNIRYDKCGRMTQYGDMSYAYNERGRLEKIFKKNNLLVELFYNYKGQRVIEKRGNKEYYYIYDNKDRVLAKYSNQGKVIKEYLYEEEIPSGFIQDDKVYYYHYDLMNFPIIISDKSGKAIRQVQYKPYGEILSFKGELEDSLRFPGQYGIKNTKLYYNLNRTYLSISGRYLETDKIKSNNNIYQYAGCNPNFYIDLKGNQNTDCCELKSPRYWTYKTYLRHCLVLKKKVFLFFPIITVGMEVRHDLEKCPLYLRENEEIPWKCWTGKIKFVGVAAEINITAGGIIKELGDIFKYIPDGFKFMIKFRSIRQKVYPSIADFKAKNEDKEDHYDVIKINLENENDSFCNIGYSKSYFMKLISKAEFDIGILKVVKALKFRNKLTLKKSEKELDCDHCRYD